MKKRFSVMRIGFVGCGLAGDTYINSIKKYSHLQLVAVTDRDQVSTKPGEVQTTNRELRLVLYTSRGGESREALRQALRRITGPCDEKVQLRFPITLSGIERGEILRRRLRCGLYLETNYNSPLPPKSECPKYPNTCVPRSWRHRQDLATKDWRDSWTYTRI